MSASTSRVVHGLVNPKLLMSVAAALMLSACSGAMDRFASNPSDSDPVYTASVPKQKMVKEAAADEGSDAIVSRPLANASVKPPAYNYTAKYKAPAYKQPEITRQAASETVEPVIEAPSAAVGGTVTVGQGMTLYSIARANNLAVAELAAANRIKPPYAVHSGQVLRIPGGSSAALPQSRKPRHTMAAAGNQHEVGSGDTLFSLGRKYGVSPYTIADANGLSHNTQLHLGQKVKIPGASGTPFAMKQADKVAPPKKLAVVETGDSATASKIAKPVKTAAALPKADATENVVSAVPQPEKMAQVQPVDTTVAGMRWPVRGKVISNFGGKPNGLKNEGINISVPEGTSIRAADGGVVAYAGNELKGYGNLVLIRHEGGYVTAYAHAKELFVKRGDTVKRGDVIAKAGQTGSVSSPQLHFEVRKGATALDPMKFLASSTASN